MDTLNYNMKMMLNVYKDQYSNTYLDGELVTFQQLIKWLKMTIISNNKFANGTFLIGEMKEDKHRKDENVINRHALVIDIDDLSKEADVINDIKEKFNFSYILYTTHNHEPQAPRYRLIIPLNKPITKKYYKPALKLFEKQLGLSFDEKAFDWSRCMARTSLKSKDSEFIFKYQDTYFLDTETLIDGLDTDESEIIDKLPLKRDGNHWLEIGFGVASGGRNSALASITGHLARCGVDINLIVALLTNWNMQNQPMIPQKEFERTIKSILTKEQNRIASGGGKY